jgi:hypothetical protein
MGRITWVKRPSNPSSVNWKTKDKNTKGKPLMFSGMSGGIMQNNLQRRFETKPKANKGGFQKVELYMKVATPNSVQPVAKVKDWKARILEF